MPRTEDFIREDVLEQAKEVFWRRGFNGTSMQDLVDATGLNRSSLYNSFGSKSELYQLCLKTYKQQTHQWLDGNVKQESNGLERVRGLFKGLIDNILGDTENKGCMILNCSTEMGDEPFTHGIAKNNQKDFVACFRNLVEEGQADGSLNAGEDALVMAHYLSSAFNGLRITGITLKDPGALEGIANKIIRSIQ